MLRMASTRNHPPALLLSLVVCLSATPLARCITTRNLLVAIQPDRAPFTVPFDSSLRTGSPDLPFTDPRLTKKQPGCAQAEQVHLTLWSASAVLVSWATCDARVSKSPPPALSAKAASSVVLYGTDAKQLGSRATGVATSYAIDYSKYAARGASSYASPILHHVLLKGLKPGQRYYYGLPVGASAVNATAADAAGLRKYNFTMPEPRFPFNIAVAADVGQTYNTSVVLERLITAQPKPDVFMLIGDFTYADNWLTANESLPSGDYLKYTYQPKWDTWARLWEPLLAHIPFLHTNGNHEVEPQPNNAANAAYNYRFPVPQDEATRETGPIVFKPATPAEPFNNLYYKVEVPGVLTAIFLTSYAWNQTMQPTEQQYKWAQQQLEKVDRKKTPWLIVSWHAPWYNSYAGHYKENECMRLGYEQLLIKHRVDLVFNGHVHSYERSKPVVNNKLSECGPVHLIVGDGGNIEGIYKDFINDKPQPGFCANPKSGKQFPPYQPQACWSPEDLKNLTAYCPSSQPAWSAYREPSFGHGSLQLQNATHAKWTWFKNQWPHTKVADDVLIIRNDDDAKCAAATA